MRLLPLFAALTLAACGPSQTQVRQTVKTSAHRSVAVMPFDYRGGERNAAAPATDAFERRLRADGFSVADRGKTRVVYAASLDRKTGAYENVARAAELAAGLGVSAVVVGSCDDAFERVVQSPAAYRFDPVPPPACCYAKNPCAHGPIYDPEVDHYVDMCQGTHRKVLAARAFTDRVAGLTVRVRLIDTATRASLWETRYSATLHRSSLGQLVDQALDVVHDQFVDALLQRRF